MKIEDPAAAEGLFKKAVHHLIESKPTSSKEEKETLSLKHQILCDETAIIGVMKQEN